uniref:S5 DRBM domain-containing protein n=1 Tax=Zea mays TaxID=4577 RepID=A0A804LXC3_MAIZE
MAATATAMAIATISPAAPIPSAPFPSLPLPLGLRLRSQPLLFAASRRRFLHVPKAASWDESVPEDGGDAEESVAAGDDEDEEEKQRPEPVSSSEFQFAAPPEGYVEPAAFDELPPESPEDVAAAYESLYGPAFSGETLLGNNVFEVNRVTKVVKGGRQLSYRAIVVVGDMKGHVGVGVGKAKEVTEAITKAAMNGRRNLVTVPLTKYSTFPHRADADYGAAKVMLRPACPGSGVENALGKQLRSKNPLNNARATIKATQMMKQFKDVAEERGIPMEELWK